MKKFAAILASLIFFAALGALAQEASEVVIKDPTGGFLTNIKGGIEIWGIIVLAGSLVSAFVKDSKLPAILAKVLNLLALNVGRAQNDPELNK